MMRLRLSCLILGVASSIAITAASANWLTTPELNFSPVPRERHGKTGAARIKRAARKYKNRRKHVRGS